jgi:hypothetical protein
MLEAGVMDEAAEWIPVQGLAPRPCRLSRESRHRWRPRMGAPRPMKMGKMGTTASPWRYDAAADQALRPDSLRWPAILRYVLLAHHRCPSLWRWGNDKLSGHLDLRFDGVRNEAVSFGAFHDLTGWLKLGFALDRYKGANRHYCETVFAVDVFK